MRPSSSGVITAISTGSDREKTLDSEEFRICQFNPIEGELPFEGFKRDFARSPKKSNKNRDFGLLDSSLSISSSSFFFAVSAADKLSMAKSSDFRGILSYQIIRYH